MKQAKSLWPIFLTVFLDLLGLGIVIPIAAPLLLTPSQGMLPLSAGMSERSIVLGFLLGVFSLAQFFGAPVLGALADRYGRKKLLLLSLTGTLAGNVLFALGIRYQRLDWCFASRILDGFTGGNISIAMSAIADVSDEKSRSRNFGLVGMSFGLGFILGPFLGGILSDPKLVSWFTFATPYWFSSMLGLANIAVMLLVFRETLQHRNETPIRPFSGIRNISRALRDTKLRLIFSVVFLMVFGFNFFTQFFQVFLIHRFAFGARDIAYLFAYIGLWLAFTQGGLNRPLSKRFSPETLCERTALLSALSFPLLLLPGRAAWLYLVVPLIAVFNGINTPNLTAVVSLQAGSREQGAMLGMRQSVMSLAMAIPPIAAGLITTLNASLPIWAAAVCTLAAWALFRYGFLPQQRRN